ncbi:MAG TPA: T9SS type A sorting domain-containing protein [Bacteroidales bacterium]|nr:T9SS type A sorting domain-containing protein [Bacteroidales bacterium]
MKKILFFIPLFLMFTSIFSQNVIIKDRNAKQILPLTNEEFFEKADFIFEGILIEGESVGYDTGGKLNENDIYTSQTLQIIEVHKGNDKLKKGTIELIRKGGRLYFLNEMGWKEMVYTNMEGCLETDINYPAIFFCVYSDYPQNKEPKNFDNNITLKFLCDRDYASLQIGSISWEPEHHIKGLNYLNFETREAMYDYMRKFKNIVVPQKKNVLEKINEQKLLFETFMQKQEKTAKIARKNLLKLNKQTKNDVNLTITIQNQQVTCSGSNSGPFYFEFDVCAHSNTNSTYYSNAILRLNFNTAAFGTNLVANNKVVLSKGSQFNNPTYETHAYDVSATQINISLNAQQGEASSWTRTRLTTDPKQLFHVKIELLPNLNNISSNLSFADVAFTSFFSLYTTTANASWQDAISYDNTYYVNPTNYNITTPLPIPTISTNLDNITLNAGVGDILTINGNNFGNQPGKVLFSSADKGGFVSDTVAYLKGLNNCYIDFWSDTAIRVIVPSLVKDGYNDITPPFQDGAGSGKIKIKTASGTTCVSSTSLNIGYSITNYGDGSENYPFKRVYLAKLNCTNGLVFTLHNNLQNNLDAINAIQAALTKWSSLLSIDLVLERDENNNLVFTNNTNVTGKNVIHFDSNQNGGMATVQQFGVGVPAQANGGIRYYRKSGSNIRISYTPNSAGNLTWNYSTSGTVPNNSVSFYNAFLHELGHIVLLEHVNSTSDLMYYSMYPGADIVDLTSTTNNVLAALTTVNQSMNISWETPYIGTIGTPPTPTPTISIVTGSPTICNSSVILRSSSTSDNTWSNGEHTQDISVNTPGTYTVTVLKNGCAAISAPVIVDGLVSSLVANNLSCQNANDGSILTSIQGGTPPYTYAWHQDCYTWNAPTTQNIYNLKPCGFNVTITDNNGCSVVNSAKVSNPPVLSTTIALNKNAATAMPNGGTPPYTYLWYEQGNVKPKTTKTINVVVNRTYYVTVTDACGEQATASIFIGGQKNISENSSDFDFSNVQIFPNPCNGTFQITNISNTDIAVYNILNKKIYEAKNIDNTDINIDLRNVANGIYYVEIIENNNRHIKKLIIAK